jgi:hypothetical protein
MNMGRVLADFDDRSRRRQGALSQRALQVPVEGARDGEQPDVGPRHRTHQICRSAMASMTGSAPERALRSQRPYRSSAGTQNARSTDGGRRGTGGLYAEVEPGATWAIESRGRCERALLREARAWLAGSVGLAGCGASCPAGPGSRDRPLGANVPWVEVVEHLAGAGVVLGRAAGRRCVGSRGVFCVCGSCRAGSGGWGGLGGCRGAGCA